MKTLTYKIGTYKSGQQIANEVYESENLKDVEREFKRMFNATEFCPEGTDNEPENSDQAWNYKHFCEDTNNVAVFEVEGNEPLYTNYAYQCYTSKIMR